MAKVKHLGKVLELFDKSPVVDFKSIERIANVKKGGKSNYAKLIVFNLINRGRVHKLTKGFYSKYDDATLSVFCFRPAYLGLQSALSFQGIWDQETIPIIMTQKKVRVGKRHILGQNVLVRRIEKKYFYGIEYLKEGNFYLPYSDVEKTFIDMVIFNQKMSEEVLHSFRERIDKNKLRNYIKKCPLVFQKRILKAYSDNE